MRCRQVFLCTLVMTIVAGCGGSSPPFKTIPVSGKIVFKGKGRIDRLERGKVWFQSTSDPSLKAVGSIGEEGAFSMSTLTEEKGWPGVPAGQYKVRLEIPLDEERNPQTGLVHPKYLDYDKSGITVTVPVPDEFTIEVERPR